eukprot:scaffold3667_cov180-Amphora_coffeaeformis.AAC.20
MQADPRITAARKGEESLQRPPLFVNQNSGKRIKVEIVDESHDPYKTKTTEGKRAKFFQNECDKTNHIKDVNGSGGGGGTESHATVDDLLQDQQENATKDSLLMCKSLNKVQSDSYDATTKGNMSGGSGGMDGGFQSHTTIDDAEQGTRQQDPRSGQNWKRETVSAHASWMHAPKQQQRMYTRPHKKPIPCSRNKTESTVLIVNFKTPFAPCHFHNTTKFTRNSSRIRSERLDRTMIRNSDTGIRAESDHFIAKSPPTPRWRRNSSIFGIGLLTGVPTCWDLPSWVCRGWSISTCWHRNPGEAFGCDLEVVEGRRDQVKKAVKKLHPLVTPFRGRGAGINMMSSWNTGGKKDHSLESQNVTNEYISAPDKDNWEDAICRHIGAGGIKEDGRKHEDFIVVAHFFCGVRSLSLESKMMTNPKCMTATIVGYLHPDHWGSCYERWKESTKTEREGHALDLPDGVRFLPGLPTAADVWPNTHNEMEFL